MIEIHWPSVLLGGIVSIVLLTVVGFIIFKMKFSSPSFTGGMEETLGVDEEEFQEGLEKLKDYKEEMEESEEDGE